MHFVKQVDEAGYPRAAEHVFTFAIAVEQMIIYTRPMHVLPANL